MTARLRNALRTKKWTTTQIALVVRKYPDFKAYPDASPEPTPELSEESSPEDSGVEPSESFIQKRRIVTSSCSTKT